MVRKKKTGTQPRNQMELFTKLDGVDNGAKLLNGLGSLFSGKSSSSGQSPLLERSAKFSILQAPDIMLSPTAGASKQSQNIKGHVKDSVLHLGGLATSQVNHLHP